MPTEQPGSGEKRGKQKKSLICREFYITFFRENPARRKEPAVMRARSRVFLGILTRLLWDLPHRVAGEERGGAREGSG